MQTLKEILMDAHVNGEKGQAIGHFNATTVEMVWGIFDAARKVNVPVVVGFSEGERDFFGVKQAPMFIKSLREEYNFPIYCNADHTYSVERVKEAIDVGFDAVIYDGAKLSTEENTANTKACVDYARQTRPDVLVEAEMGYIGTSSKMWDKVPEGASQGEAMFTKPEEAKAFVEATGIDLFAPAVGNIHGMFKGGANPALDISRIKEVKEAAGVPLVLHGGSGITDENFREAILAGISLIHVSTEIRVAYRKALDDFLASDKDELAPYRIFKPSREAVADVVEKKLLLFSGK